MTIPSSSYQTEKFLISLLVPIHSTDMTNIDITPEKFNGL